MERLNRPPHRRSKPPPPPRTITILDAINDPNLFAPHFKNRKTWQPWFSFLASLFGLPLSPDQLDTYRAHTGRTDQPKLPFREAWLVVGRRGGKSFILALTAVYLACFHEWRKFLNVGERGTVMIVAADRKQARTIMRYITGLLRSVPMLRQLIENSTAERITLRNRIIIEIHTASYTSTRGYTIVAALLDELAFWPSDEQSAQPDVEVLNAIKPGMATIPDAMLLCASSPHARRGALWDSYHRHYAKDRDPVLVWRAATRDMNATVPQKFIDQHLEDDPARAAPEYLAEFRSDIEGFVSREAVTACVSVGVRENPPMGGFRYYAFVDPSGGSSDAITLAISHRERTGDVVVIDAVREIRPPLSPEAVVREFALLLKSYGVTKVVGDKYAGMWPREQFRKHGLTYETSELTKSDLYLNLLPLINSTRIDLLDHPRLFNQLISLERRTARSGKDSIDHPPGAHDDVANSVAGAAVLAAARRTPMRFSQEVKQWAAIPQRVEGRWISFGVRKRALVNIDQRPGTLPSSPAPEPVMPRSPGISASGRLVDGTSTTRTPMTEFIQTINSRDQP
jgi:hypothetical protein